MRISIKRGKNLYYYIDKRQEEVRGAGALVGDHVHNSINELWRQ